MDSSDDEGGSSSDDEFSDEDLSDDDDSSEDDEDQRKAARVKAVRCAPKPPSPVAEGVSYFPSDAGLFQVPCDPEKLTEKRLLCMYVKYFVTNTAR